MRRQQFLLKVGDQGKCNLPYVGRLKIGKIIIKGSDPKKKKTKGPSNVDGK